MPQGVKAAQQVLILLDLERYQVGHPKENMIRVNLNDMMQGGFARPCKDITSEVIIGPSPIDKYYMEKERAKKLPMVLDKSEKVLYDKD